MSSESPAPIGPIADWLAGHAGISTAIIGAHTLTRAIQQRLKLTGLADLAAYQQHLFSTVEEQQCLVELVVVPETWFFRDRHPYNHLSLHARRLHRDRAAAEPLRLLSAPCATGEEPYSMAITLLDAGLSSQAFTIDAIDICRRSIRRAREAVYSRHSFRGVSEAEKQRHFQSGPAGLELDAAIRGTVRFRCANLMTCLAGSSSRYDVIFCRNLLIYLEDPASERLLTALAGLLRPGGLLIVGSAEVAKVPTTLFRPIRESFVFGFLRLDSEHSPPAAVASAESPSAAPHSLLHRPTRPRRRQPLAAMREPTPAAPVADPDPPCLAAAQPPPPSHDEVLERQLQMHRRDLEQNPTSEQAYLKLGRLLLMHNRHEEASDCLRRCLYLRPDCREAMETLIQLSQQLGQTQRSRHYQARLERLDS